MQLGVERTLHGRRDNDVNDPERPSLAKTAGHLTTPITLPVHSIQWGELGCLYDRRPPLRVDLDLPRELGG
jgi:hypothetical protein